MPHPCPPILLVSQAVEGDSLAQIADTAGIPLGQLLRDNVAAIPALSAPLVGKALLLCTSDTGKQGHQPRRLKRFARNRCHHCVVKVLHCPCLSYIQ